MDLRSLQKTLKEQYRHDPNASQITLRAKGGQSDVRSHVRSISDVLFTVPSQTRGPARLKSRFSLIGTMLDQVQNVPSAAPEKTA
jgi:hypothetical protein